MIKVSDLLSDEIRPLTGDIGLENEIKSGYACDLLSWVMAKGKPGTAWITVQNHLNVIAVASMMDFACVILPEDIKADQTVLDKAIEENIAVLTSSNNAYDLCSKLRKMGI